MSLLNTFFPSVGAAFTEKVDKKTLEKEKSNLEKRVEELQESLKQERRISADQEYLAEKKYTRAVEEADFELSKVNALREEEEKRYARRLARAEEDRADDIAHEVRKEKVKLEAKLEEEYADKLEAEKVSARAAEEKAAGYAAQANERQTVIKSLEGQLKDYREFVQFAMTKLPDVDLSKFNISVDVPKTEIQVVNTGGKKN